MMRWTIRNAPTPCIANILGGHNYKRFPEVLVCMNCGHRVELKATDR